jgi:arylsulfatase A-like enzyme
MQEPTERVKYGVLMQRRHFLSLLSSTASGAPTPQPPPNFVFIMADDLGVFDLGCYGQKQIRTPHIDRLASQGTRFTSCYAGASVCAPSRSVLMTGQHTGHTTVRANASLRTGQRVALRADDLTVATVLKGPEWKHGYDENYGYSTGIFGKWGLGEPGTAGLPNDHGFDEWFGFLNQQHAHYHYPDYLWRNRSKEPLKGNFGGQKREYASDLFIREALHFIDRHRYEPFFLYFTPTIPHAQFDAPSLGGYANEAWPEEARHYAAMVTRMDSYVGSIMARLEDTGLAANTVVFFCSDNGGTFDGPFGTMGPLRGKKGSNYEGGLRIPMIVRWPGQVAAGAVSDFPWSFADVLPTLADLAGARGIPRQVDGISVAPMLLGRKQNAERPIYWESHDGGGFQQAVRLGPWKALRSGLEGAVELYDLSVDPGEKANVAATQPAVVRRIEEFLTSARMDAPEYPVRGRRRVSLSPRP